MSSSVISLHEIKRDPNFLDPSLYRDAYGNLNFRRIVEVIKSDDIELVRSSLSRSCDLCRKPEFLLQCLDAGLLRDLTILKANFESDDQTRYMISFLYLIFSSVYFVCCLVDVESSMRKSLSDHGFVHDIVKICNDDVLEIRKKGLECLHVLVDHKCGLFFRLY